MVPSGFIFTRFGPSAPSAANRRRTRSAIERNVNGDARGCLHIQRVGQKNMRAAVHRHGSDRHHSVVAV